MKYPLEKIDSVCDKNISRIKTITVKDFEYIDISSIDRLSKTIISTTRWNVETAPGRAQQVVKENDLLVSTVRPNLNAIALVPYFTNNTAVIASTGFAVLRATEKVLPKWLFFFCQTNEFIDSLVKVSEKASYPSVTDSIVRNVMIPLPSIPVQHEIVARLEKELEKVDKMAESFKRMAELADEEFNAVLSETFENIEGKRVKLGDVCETSSGGTPLKSHSEYYEKGTIPWLRSGEVNKKDIQSTEIFITQAGMMNSSAKLFPPNTVLVAMYGATAGQVGILRIPSTTNQAVCGILPGKYIPEFLYYQLTFLKKKLVSQAVGGAQPNVSQEKVKNLNIQWPPMFVQQEIVSCLEKEFSRVEMIGNLSVQGLSLCSELRKSILQEAFS